METWKNTTVHFNYEVSNLGRVRNKKTLYILKPMFNRCGYHRVELGEKAYSVHRLVCLSFIENPEGLPDINHKNGIKTDNRLNNLEWISTGDNQKHAYSFGLRDGKGDRNPASKLTENEVLTIRARSLRWCGFSVSMLAHEFSVHQSRIEKIRARTNWSHL